MRDEGVTKYRVDFRPAAEPDAEEVENLIACRDRLFARGLIGVYPDGIGFGNVSARIPKTGHFFITGTQTGHLPKLRAEHIARVTGYSIAENRVECRGPVQASSESLTHAAVYELEPTIGAVIHIHQRELWRRALQHLPTTNASIPYGTPAMAREMQRLYKETNLKEVRALVMAGHEEGCITFGANLAQAELALEGAIKLFGR
ncbi:class II aldolase/adducin family protein [Turneriella parva]|uniref:Class II aldolase/adducin family protein n=1 Tax=Turneriella parva (strain ATCC BAA-1111 / DSM 21527 / NCTC 11395 / H) TaxID=869212 RepID=I4B707_TURPD|nr:class II aldolase/adducin family protein [Turneriella parva]AFM13064.1 class II aldolase/adducin family protein [Turneriella parva DSM 21527]